MPFGLRGGLPLYGAGIARPAMVLATADGHPRAIAYTSWVPVRTPPGSSRTRSTVRWWPCSGAAPRPSCRRRDATSSRMNIGWVLVWQASPQTIRYLTGTGFVFDYRADGVSVYRPGWK